MKYTWPKFHSSKSGKKTHWKIKQKKWLYKVYFVTSDLRFRCWTLPMIKEHLPSHDDERVTMYGGIEKLYDKKRVILMEKKPALKAALKKSRAASRKREAAWRQLELEVKALVATWKIIVPKVSIPALIKAKIKQRKGMTKCSDKDLRGMVFAGIEIQSCPDAQIKLLPKNRQDSARWAVRQLVRDAVRAKYPELRAPRIDPWLSTC